VGAADPGVRIGRSQPPAGQVAGAPAAAATRDRLSRVLPPLVALGGLGALWQLGGSRDPLVVPPLAGVVRALVEHSSYFLDNALTTLGEVGVGLGASTAVAFVLAVAMCEVRALERALMPLAVGLNVTPLVAVAPALVIAFGFGAVPKYVLTALIVFFPLLVNALAGLKSVDPGVLDLLRTMDASRLEVLVHLRLPSCVPHLFLAARVCVPLAVVGAVVAEFSAPGSARGLGSVIETAFSQSDLTTMYAATLVLAVLGIALAGLERAVEHRVVYWRSATLG